MAVVELFVGAGAGDIAAFYYMSCRYGYEAITYLQSIALATEADGRDVVVLSSTPGSGSGVLSLLMSLV